MADDDKEQEQEPLSNVISYVDDQKKYWEDPKHDQDIAKGHIKNLQRVRDELSSRLPNQQEDIPIPKSDPREESTAARKIRAIDADLKGAGYGKNLDTEGTIKELDATAAKKAKRKKLYDNPRSGG